MELSTEEIASVYARRYAGFRLAAAAILRDSEAAHDAVQDGFARALVDRTKWRGGSPEAWIWRIVERRAFDELRRRRGRQPEADFEIELIDDAPNPALAEAVKALTPRRRLVVFLRYFADLSYTDVARICGISEGTVAATLSDAHADLARALEREEVEPWPT